MLAVTYRKPFRLALLSLVAVALLLTAVGTISALPGTSKSGAASALSTEQHELIASLHQSYRSAMGRLDWTIAEQGHDPATLQRAQELQSALRQAIFEVIHRGSDAAPTSASERCPYSDKTVPVGTTSDTATLLL